MALVAPYPQPRLNRTGAGGAAGVAPAPGATIPRVRLWAFELVSTNSDPHVVVSDRFTGFGVVSDIELSIAAGNAGGGLRLTVLVGNSDSGARNGGADITLPEGAPIFDPRDYSDPNDVNASSEQALALVGAQTYATVHRLPARVPVVSNEFFLKVFLQGLGGVPTSVQGFARIMEGLTEDEVSNFL